MIFYSNNTADLKSATVGAIKSVWVVLAVHLLSCGSPKEPTDDGYSENAPEMLFYAATGEIEIDSAGSELWHRTDSYYFDSEEDAAATASEHVIRTESGTYASVMDQDFGIGLLVLDVVP